MEDWHESGCHVAAFDQTFGKAKPIFLQYRLPAVLLPPPIQVQRTVHRLASAVAVLCVHTCLTSKNCGARPIGGPRNMRVGPFFADPRKPFCNGACLSMGKVT